MTAQKLYNALFFKMNTLFRKLLLCAILCYLPICSNVHAESKELAITIDDLPYVGDKKNFHLNMIIDTAKSNQVPLTGFVIAKTVDKSNWETLRKFREAGFNIGNHTLSHVNLNRVTADQYIQDIDDADKILASVMSEPKFFRYPYLAMSKGDKKNKVLGYLSYKNYHVAPITIDSKDFIFNQLLMSVPEANRRGFFTHLKASYLDYIWEQTLLAEEHSRELHKPDRTQILLIHSNLLNAYALADIIQLYRQHGYTLVSLNDALSNTHKPKQMPAKPEVQHESIADFFQWD